MNEGNEGMVAVMKAYADSAKSFTQLSTAALALPVVFQKQLFDSASVSSGASSVLQGPAMLLVVGSWLLFLTAVGAGTFYQYVSTKCLELHLFPDRTYVHPLMRRFAEAPGRTYGVMLTAFFLGATLFVAYSILILWRNYHP
jgi:hypothetical protein